MAGRVLPVMKFVWSGGWTEEMIDEIRDGWMSVSRCGNRRTRERDEAALAQVGGCCPKVPYREASPQITVSARYHRPL